MPTIFDAIIAANLHGQRAQIHEVVTASPMFDVDVVAIDGRMLQLSDGRWVADFASCNYLGLDLDEDVIAAIEPMLRRWGVHPSWARLVASPQLYAQCEQALAQLIGTEEFLILPTVTLTHLGVIPALVGKDGVLLLDKFGHMTMYEAAKVARDSGAKLASFPHHDFAALEALLHEHAANARKVILVDGVYSMTGAYADLPRLCALARAHGAIVYVDDAHGFGVVGEAPDAEMPYGHRGNGLVRHYGLDYDRDHVMYVVGFSKAYSSLAAGVACNRNTKEFLKAFATPYDLSGPSPTASLASLLAGLAVNQVRGERYRATLHRLTRKALVGLRALGYSVESRTEFPILSVWIGDTQRLIRLSRILLDRGVLVTLGPYPMVPRGKEVLRITLTSANTDAQVETLLAAFAHARDRVDLTPDPPRDPPPDLRLAAPGVR